MRSTVAAESDKPVQFRPECVARGSVSGEVAAPATFFVQSATTELGLRDLLVLCGVEEGTVVIAESNGSETGELDEYGRRRPRIRPDRKDDVVDPEPHPNRPVLSWLRSWFAGGEGRVTTFFKWLGIVLALIGGLMLIVCFRPFLVEVAAAMGKVVRWIFERK